MSVLVALILMSWVSFRGQNILSKSSIYTSGTDLGEAEGGYRARGAPADQAMCSH